MTRDGLLRLRTALCRLDQYLGQSAFLSLHRFPSSFQLFPCNSANALGFANQTRLVRVPAHDGHDSGMMADSIPEAWRTVFRRQAGQF